MSNFADRMCECKDPKCAQGVLKGMIEWVKQHFSGKQKKGTKKNVAKWKKSQKKFNRCYGNAIGCASDGWLGNGPGSLFSVEGTSAS